jgi:hypothetical protein
MWMYDLDSMLGVPGWFMAEDFVMFEGIDQVQRASRIKGDLLEIGVYHGKSAILLGQFRAEDEELVVCDVFDSDVFTSENERENVHFYQGLTRLAFESNYARYHQGLPRILQCPSTEIPNLRLTRSFRFVHIDGSHLYENVRADLRTAKELMFGSGIVAVDDWRSHEFPGTAYAFWEEVNTGGLVPICHTPQKMYATWDPSRLAGRLMAWCAKNRLLLTTPGTIGGRPALQVEPSEALRALCNPSPEINSARRIVLSLMPPALTSIVRRSRRRVRRPWARRRSPGGDLT